ncbi:MAG: glycosyltransferase, partial [Lachnospiraceae bacterium]|nr:glycosyltransferase [Lachnospiraceae bacterium]
MNQNKYEQELFAQRTPYLQWLKQQETTLDRQYGQQLEQGALGKQIHTLPFSSCMDHMDDVGHARDHSFAEFEGDRIYLFAKDAGRLSPYAEAVFAKAFLEDADVVLAYADEDYSGSLRELYGIREEDRQSGARYRGAPWFKPGFSPDTLASFFYVGSVFAVRGDQILEMTGKYGSDISLHELVYRIFMEALDRRRQGRTCGIAHLPYTLYTSDSLADKDRTDGDGKIRLLYRAEERCTGADNDKISIVIPSKDNADVLQKCLETLVQHTHYGCYEIIVVDNGSSPEQRARISHVIETLKTRKRGLVVHYLYRERAFNFSAMCNAGARQASGAYLLFLNDDIEILGGADGGQWLDRMLAYGRKSHVGAVGAKLYYP